MIADAAYQYRTGVDFLRHFAMYAQNLTASFKNSNDFGSYLAVVALVFIGMAACATPLARWHEVGNQGHLASGRHRACQSRPHR